MVATLLRAAEDVAGGVPDISDRQFARGLWGDGIITFDECEAFVSTGVIPAAMQKLIDALPDDDTGAPTERKEAIIFVRGAKTYERSNSFVDQLGTAFGWDPGTLDAKWRAWGLL
jgi:hypothetical protein